MTLLLSSWLLVLLTVFTMAFHREARTEVRRSRFEHEQVVMRGLALSGITAGKSLLLESSNNDWDAPVEGWNYNDGLRRVPLGSGFFSIGHVDLWSKTPKSIYGAEDEESLLPLWLVNEELLAKIPGLTDRGAQLLMGAVVRSDSQSSIDLSSLELDSWSHAATQKYFTGYRTDGVNINTASPEILSLLDIPERAVASIVKHRNGRDGVVGTRDDRPFSSVLVPEGGLEECNLRSVESAMISSLARDGVLIVHSNHFRIKARGYLADQPNFHEIEAVLLRLQEQSFRVLSWREVSI